MGVLFYFVIYQILLQEVVLASVVVRNPAPQGFYAGVGALLWKTDRRATPYGKYTTGYMRTNTADVSQYTGRQPYTHLVSFPSNTITGI